MSETSTQHSAVSGQPEHISPAHLRDALDAVISGMFDRHLTLRGGLNAFRTEFVRAVLRDARGHQGHAASRLRIHRNTLVRLLEQDIELASWLLEFKHTRPRQKNLQFYRPAKPFPAHDAGVGEERRRA